MGGAQLWLSGLGTALAALAMGYAIAAALDVSVQADYLERVITPLTGDIRAQEGT
jgi:hypothetical protein